MIHGFHRREFLKTSAAFCLFPFLGIDKSLFKLDVPDISNLININSIFNPGNLVILTGDSRSNDVFLCQICGNALLENQSVLFLDFQPEYHNIEKILCTYISLPLTELRVKFGQWKNIWMDYTEIESKISNLDYRRQWRSLENDLNQFAIEELCENVRERASKNKIDVVFINSLNSLVSSKKSLYLPALLNYLVTNLSLLAKETETGILIVIPFKDTILKRYNLRKFLDQGTIELVHAFVSLEKTAFEVRKSPEFRSSKFSVSLNEDLLRFEDRV